MFNLVKLLLIITAISGIFTRNERVYLPLVMGGASHMPTNFSSGPRYPGTGADDASSGTYAYTNPGNITTFDSVYATNNIYPSGGLSHYLKGTGYGSFGIPAHGVITGIKLEVNAVAPFAWPTCNDKVVRLLKAGSAVGSNKGNAGNLYTGQGWSVYGGPGDLWTVGWTATEINNDIGAWVQYENNAGPPAGWNPYVDAHRITVYYTLNDNADLSNLTLSAGTLSPAFASGTTSYTASVPYTTTSLTVTPTASDAYYTGITVNGVAVSSGSPSGAINLNVGTNTITIICTAEDGITTKTYTVVVTREIAARSSGTAFLG